MTIKIPVSADFDPSQIDAQLQQFSQKMNALGQQIANANKVQFDPINSASLDDLKKMTAQFESLKRVSGDFNRRLKATGQEKTGFADLNWEQMFPDKHSRARQMAKSYQYVTGKNFHASANTQTDEDERQSKRRRGPSLGGSVANVAQSGLNAMGPVGGVGARALGTGMSAGFGAGLMGLVGGLAALGVSKLVGAVTEKIGEAEKNSESYDTLKRIIGDVNVSFDALKMSIKSTADANKITYQEAIKLSTEFTKISGLSAEQHQEALSKNGSVSLGIGMSRSYGMDPSTGVRALASVRAVGATRDEAQARRFAVIVGETIGKSGAFSRAEAIMAAVTDYTVAQTRSNLGPVNTSGYGGAFAGFINSGIAGFDETGTSNLLNKVNAALTAGGAMGEASQYFTNTVGRRMGLDSIQTEIMREGGAFSTNDTSFGEGSMYARYMGKEGPTGDSTHLSEQLKYLKEAYGHDKGLLAQATAKHLGVTMSQSMAMHNVTPKEMGQLSNYVDPKSVTGESLGNISKAVFGSSEDRADLANSLSRRTGADALSGTEIKMLDKAFSIDGDEGAEIQRKVLAELISSRGQESTEGKDIRDSKVLLDNLKTSMAEKLIPMTQTMRDGILSIAGVGKDGQTTESLLTDMATAESENRQKALVARHHGRLDDFKTEAKANGLTSGSPAYQAEIMRLQEQFAAESAAEVKLLKQKVEGIKENLAVQQEQDAEAERMRQQRNNALMDELIEQQNSSSPDRFTATADGPSGAGAGAASLASSGAVNASGKLTRGYRNNNPGNIEAGIGFQGETGSDGRFAKFNTPEMGYRALGKNLLTYKNKHGLDTIRGIISRWAPPNENDTEAYISYVSKQMGISPDQKLDMKDQGILSGLIKNISVQENGYQRHDNSVIEAGASLALGGQGTPLPDGGAAGSQKSQGITVEPLEINVTHTNDKGQQVQPMEKLTTQFKNNYYGNAS